MRFTITGKAVSFNFLAAAAVFCIIAISSCGSSSQTVESNDLKNLEAMFWERLAESRAHFTQSEVEFMTDMIGHHAQALVISKIAPDNTDTRQIQVLAARIINAQKDEIAFMQNWLRDRNQIVPEINIVGTQLTVRGGGHTINHRDMPGMLTDVQIRQLAHSKNKDFDRLYLELMIQHHNGAVIMVERLFDTDGVGFDEDTFRLAADIHVDQITEINRMKSMLEEMDEQQASMD